MGRSTLEGASFIVSSAYADPRLHGRAFQPRLSGITNEMLHIWTLAVAGPRPFRLDEGGRLSLALEPRLPGWLFTEAPVERSFIDSGGRRVRVKVPANAFAFRFLGRCAVTYENPSRRDTWGRRGAAPVRWKLKDAAGKAVTVDGPVLPQRLARQVRAGDVARMTVRLD